jgi:hypothetical protein
MWSEFDYAHGKKAFLLSELHDRYKSPRLHEFIRRVIDACAKPCPLQSHGHYAEFGSNVILHDFSAVWQ